MLGALDVEDPGITGVRQVASGTVHRCVITNIGGVKCWGDNSEGQLGIGSDELTEEVVDVVGFVQEKRAPTTSTTQVSTTTTVSPSSTTSLPIRKPRLIEDPRWRPERTTGVSIEVNGRKVSVVLKVESGKLRVKAAEVNLEIRGSDVEELNLDPESMDPIGVDPPEEFMIDVDGLEPGSEIAAVVYSEPVMLGQEVVGADGAAHLSVRIPSTLESGSHTLVLEGVSAEGESVMAQLGIRVNSSQGTVDWRWLALLVILFGIVVALALPAVKTRRVRPGT